eukprot:3359856-Prymnesium_polylepis.1
MLPLAPSRVAPTLALPSSAGQLRPPSAEAARPRAQRRAARAGRSPARRAPSASRRATCTAGSRRRSAPR